MVTTPTAAAATEEGNDPVVSSPAGEGGAATAVDAPPQQQQHHNNNHNKKIYICAAPRPPEYEQLVEGVLRGMGSRAEAVLETTLDRIQNQHHWQRKSGPGRKSNAEHAIHFYEHLLEQIKARKDQKQQQDNNNNVETNEGKEQTENSVAENINPEENDGEDVSENGDDNDDVSEPGAGTNKEEHDNEGAQTSSNNRSDICDGMFSLLFHFCMVIISNNFH